MRSRSSDIFAIIEDRQDTLLPQGDGVLSLASLGLKLNPLKVLGAPRGVE